MKKGIFTFLIFFILLILLVIGVAYFLPAYLLMLVWNYFVPLNPVSYWVAFGIWFFISFFLGIQKKVTKKLKRRK